jgi:hypothetical protein
MIQQTTAPTRINGNRVEVEVLGRQKLLATVQPGGMDLWCKVLSFSTRVSYTDLMSIPTFRAGVLAVLEGEQAAQDEERV